MRYRTIGIYITLALMGCKSEPEKISQRVQLPDSEAEVLVGAHPFGGGAGSINWTFYLDDGKTRQRIASLTSLYEPEINFEPESSMLRLVSCKADVSQQVNTSDLPYGKSYPLIIQIKNQTDCGYEPYPEN